MKALLNAKIKRRESFRPFAPSVLEDAVAEWFEEDDAVAFMMRVFQIREKKRKFIPAVTHVDGSGVCRRYRLSPIRDTTGLLRAFASSRAYQWCSTHLSTRTSLLSASQGKRWIAS